MNQPTIQLLNQLNQQFYSQVNQQFNQTRQYFWQGWHKVKSEIEQLISSDKSLSVLDLGCGNGRFGLFLDKHLPPTIKINYVGIDNNLDLLSQAKTLLSDQSTHLNFSLKSIDLVDQLLNHNLVTHLEELTHRSANWQLISVFGVLHHIPSFELRSKLIQSISKLLANNGLAVVTAWQFAQDQRYQKRSISKSEIPQFISQLNTISLPNLDPNQLTTELEENDFLLDWKKGKQAWRYCHFVDQAEFNHILTKTELKISQLFFADGRSGELNRYYLLTKNRTKQPSENR